MIVNLVVLGLSLDNIEWKLGKTFIVDPSPKVIASFLAEKMSADVDYWFFWDPDLGSPDEGVVKQVVQLPGNVWHAGLKLGLSGYPGFIDYVKPSWMLNLDTEPEIQSSSWRLSLRACVIPGDVLRETGGPVPDFESLEAAGLELGLRFIQRGVLVRYVPTLVGSIPEQAEVEIPLHDQLGFLKTRFGKKWMCWGILRAMLSGQEKLIKILTSLVQSRDFPTQPTAKIYPHFMESEGDMVQGKVSVLIPTINRYPYLKVLLGQLRNQSIPPHEIIIVDQTPDGERDNELLGEYSDLLLKWFVLDQAGQCSARNIGINQSIGDYILFLDDDVEAAPDLIERHLANSSVHKAAVSCGVAEEVGAGELPEQYTFLRTSDVFPSGNSLVRKEVFTDVGLFDLAFDRGQKEDGDLGNRLHLKGELMVLNPEISVLHHHAPQGGLRQHNARVKSYAEGKRNPFIRIVPSVSEIYLLRRYFSPKQVRESLWISILSTFVIKGAGWKKALKAVISFLALPHTLWQLRNNWLLAAEKSPKIPNLE